MTEYRVYMLDGQQKIAGAYWLEAKSLHAAIESIAGQYDCACEIWDGPARLAIVPAKEQNGSAPAR